MVVPSSRLRRRRRRRSYDSNAPTRRERWRRAAHSLLLVFFALSLSLSRRSQRSNTKCNRIESIQSSLSSFGPTQTLNTKPQSKGRTKNNPIPHHCHCTKEQRAFRTQDDDDEDVVDHKRPTTLGRRRRENERSRPPATTGVRGRQSRGAPRRSRGSGGEISQRGKFGNEKRRHRRRAGRELENGKTELGGRGTSSVAAIVG